MFCWTHRWEQKRRRNETTKDAIKKIKIIKEKYIRTILYAIKCFFPNSDRSCVEWIQKNVSNQHKKKWYAALEEWMNEEEEEEEFWIIIQRQTKWSQMQD